MTRFGQFLILTGICALAAGCAAPMGQREAQSRATAGLRKFCNTQPCGATRLLAAQKLKDRWLVDFDGPAGRYSVIVEAGGDTQVRVWDKTLGK